MSGDPSLDVVLRSAIHLLLCKDDALMYLHFVLMPSEREVSKVGVLSGFYGGFSHGFLTNFITALFIGTKTVTMEDLSLSLLPRSIPLA